MRIGVIGVQGAVSEHIEAIKSLGHEAVWLRRPEEVDGFVIPGGESTTITKLMKGAGLWEFVKNSNRPILGTCAGLIVLSKTGVGDTQKTGQDLMGILDCCVNRNAFGRQRESFEAEVDVSFLTHPFRGVFIRAPAVEEVFGECRPVATLEGKIVGVEQGKVLGLAFHPELANDTRVHQYFLRKVMTNG